MLPQGVLFIPLAVTLSRLRLFGGMAALIIVYPTLVIPFGTWVLWTSFHRLPSDLLDHARSEGAGPFRVLWHVLLPLSWPAVAAVALFGVAVVFNDYLYTTTFIQEPSGQTITGALGALITADIDNPGRSFAAAMLATAPLAIVCAFFADAFARGLSTGIIEQ